MDCDLRMSSFPLCSWFHIHTESLKMRSMVSASVHAEKKETFHINIAVQVGMVMNCKMNEEAVILVL